MQQDLSFEVARMPPSFKSHIIIDNSTRCHSWAPPRMKRVFQWHMIEDDIDWKSNILLEHRLHEMTSHFKFKQLWCMKWHGIKSCKIYKQHAEGATTLFKCIYNVFSSYDDVMTGKHFLHYWPFVRRIHWSPVDSPHKWPIMQSFDNFLV